MHIPYERRHTVHRLRGMPDGELHRIRNFIEITIRDDRRYLDDYVLIRLKACHLKVKPHEVIASSVLQ